MNGTTAPTFSVLCATHNQVQYLDDMLNSVTSQTRDDYELVIVDDGSTDGTAEHLHSWLAQQTDSLRRRTTIIRTEQQGQSAAYETGFAHTTGEWICLLDSDDTFLAHKLETVAQAVAGRPDIGLVQHPLLVVDAKGTLTGEIRPKSAALSSGDLRPQMRRDARHVAPGASGLVIRRSTFAALVPFPTKQFRFAADAYLSFGATATAPVIALHHSLAHYRMQPGGQYLRRMLDARGLLQQVALQETVAGHFDLLKAARRNSFFCRNVYAARRYNSSPGVLSAWGLLLRATAQDRHFDPGRKAALLVVWTFSALLPKKAFVLFWRAFQMRQTGWKRIGRRP